MSVGVLDLRVVAGEVGDVSVMQPRWRSAATAAPVVGGGERAANRGGDVACAVMLDASAEADLTFLGGHARMISGWLGIAMPKFQTVSDCIRLPLTVSDCIQTVSDYL